MSSRAVALAIVFAVLISALGLGLTNRISSTCTQGRRQWDTLERVIVVATTPARTSATERRLMARLGLSPAELARTELAQRARLLGALGPRPAC